MYWRCRLLSQTTLGNFFPKQLDEPKRTEKQILDKLNKLKGQYNKSVGSGKPETDPESQEYFDEIKTWEVDLLTRLFL